MPPRPRFAPRKSSYAGLAKMDIIQDEDIPDLPPLTPAPTVHPGSCLTLSAPLVAHIASLLPQAPGLVLSIGSGYGLLEAQILSPPHNVNVVGVEVQPSTNKYLPPRCHRCVPGSHFGDPMAREAEVWMFVYPKRVGLVDEYIREYAQGAVRKIVWAGPRQDWHDYQYCFEEGMWSVDVKIANEVGGKGWEIIAVASKIG